MTNDHDDDFQGLQETTRFTIAMFALTKSAKEFKFWYENIFKQENPNSDHFDLSFTKNDGEEVLEVAQFNGYFSVDALVVMFLGYQAEKEELTQLPPQILN